MNASKIIVNVMMSGLLFGLVGCGSSNDYKDIEVFMAQVDELPKGRIDPLPPIETIPPFSYKAGTKRSPFEPPVVIKKIDRQGGPQVTPNFNRTKQFLEQFPIGQLAIVGTLAQSGTTFGLVQDGDGGVHRVQPGDFLGTDHGQIDGISETTIDIVEIVPDGTGGWVQRARTVALIGGA